MIDYYRKHFKAYHQKTFSIDPAAFLSPLAKYLAPGCSVLDVGCGSGRDLCWLKHRGFKVTGFDRSPELAVMARENAGCRVIEGDFETYDFSKLSADAILLVGALVHLPHERVAGTLGSILKALTASGYVLVSLKEGEGTSMDAAGRCFYLWQDKELRRLFADQGLTVIEFFRQPAETGTGEVWLAYVLRVG